MFHFQNPVTHSTGENENRAYELWLGKGGLTGIQAKTLRPLDSRHTKGSGVAWCSSATLWRIVWWRSASFPASHHPLCALGLGSFAMLPCAQPVTAVTLQRVHDAIARGAAIAQCAHPKRGMETQSGRHVHRRPPPLLAVEVHRPLHQRPQPCQPDHKGAAVVAVTTSLNNFHLLGGGGQF